MKNKELIEKLEDLATFFALLADNAATAKKNAKEGVGLHAAAFWDGKEIAFKSAFNKVDKILKEAKQ